ncbi:MAG: GNAT family N-acetyltransferase [Aquificae bacterium]|nr:GNAT family N-acetyltransferase [Aquificota bacterium]
MNINFSLPNDISVIEPTVDFIYKYSLETGLDEKKAKELALAVDEVLTDVVLFAFEPDERATFEVSVNNSLNEIEVIIHELGEPFDPERHTYSPEKAKKELNFEGSGFKIAQEMADKFLYFFKGRAGKEFRIIKNIEHLHITQIFEEEDLKKEPEKTVRYTIAPVTEDDAEDIARLIYRSYGYTYPKEEMYYPKKIQQALKEGKKFGVIVRTEKGEAVGYFAVLLSTDSNIGEVGEVVVSPKHRGKGLMKMMMKALIDMAKAKGLLGLFGEAVTVHTVSQKVNAKYGFKSTALVLGFFPPAKYKGFSQGKEQRISVVIDFLHLIKRDKVEVYLPKEYNKILRKIYENMGIEVINLKTKSKKLPEKSTISLVINYNFGSAVIIVRKFGKDFEERIKKKLETLLKKDIKGIYIDLPLDEAYIKDVIPFLKKEGFIFSGLMPLFHKEKDFLRMQKVLDDFDFKHIQVFSPMAKTIKNKVYKEYKALKS